MLDEESHSEVVLGQLFVWCAKDYLLKAIKCLTNGKQETKCLLNSGLNFFIWLSSAHIRGLKESLEEPGKALTSQRGGKGRKRPVSKHNQRGCEPCDTQVKSFASLAHLP